MTRLFGIFRVPTNRDWMAAASSVAIVFVTSQVWRVDSPLPGFNDLHPRIQILLWDNAWRESTARNIPGAEDWSLIFQQLEKRGVRRAVILDEQVFSPVNVTTPGYLENFRQAAKRGMNIFAPVRLAGEIRRPFQQSVDPDLFGLPVERLIAKNESNKNVDDNGVLVNTTILDYRMFSDAAGTVLSGPAAGFAEALAGVGLLESGDRPDRFLPAMRWREDRLLAHLGLVVLPEEDGMALDGGIFKIAGETVALKSGALRMPPLPGDSALRTRSRSLADLSGTDGGAPFEFEQGTIVFLSGPGLSGSRATIGIADAALKRQIQPLATSTPLFLKAVIVLAACLVAMLRSRVWSIVTWLVVVVNGVFIFAGKSDGMHPEIIPEIIMAWTLPWGLLTTVSLAADSVFYSHLRKQLDSALSEKISMGRQARMLVHDLRRVLKVSDPASRAYVDGFLAELSALDRETSLLRKAVSLVSIAGQSLAQVAPVWSSRQLRYEIDFKHSSLVIGDPAAIRRIFDNLLDNASAASPAGGLIEVRTSDAILRSKDVSRPACALKIQNESVRLGEEKIAGMSNPSLSRSSAGRSSGRGLGLVIVRSLVEAMAGEFRISESVSDGSGSGSSTVTFEVLLPCDPQMVDPGAVRSGEDSGLAGVKYRRKLIIVVDDSPFIREAWENQLSEAEIVTYASPEDFLDAWRDGKDFSQRSVILVSDYHFDSSSMDGVTLAREALRSGIKDVVICSDWELGQLELRGTPVKVLKKDKLTVSALLEAIQNPSA